MKQKFDITYHDYFNFMFFIFSKKSLKKLDHRNVVKLKELFRQGTELYLVFELCEANLYDKMKSPDHPFTEDRIRNVMFVFNLNCLLHIILLLVIL